MTERDTSTRGRTWLAVGALVAAGSTLLPWFRVPDGGIFTLSGPSGVSAWRPPITALWPFEAHRAGIKLGWLILGLAVVLVVLLSSGARWAQIAVVASVALTQPARRPDAYDASPATAA